MSSVTFFHPDVTTFCQLDELGLVATGPHVTRSLITLECHVTAQDVAGRDETPSTFAPLSTHY